MLIFKQFIIMLLAYLPAILCYGQSQNPDKLKAASPPAYKNIMFPAGSYIFFATLKSKQAGFLVKEKNKYYAYTCQSALLFKPDFSIRSADGDTIKATGKLELSYTNDIARVEVDPGPLKDKFFVLSEKLGYGDSVKYCSLYFDSKTSSIIKGIGPNDFDLGDTTLEYFTGTPVLGADGRVVGVLRQGHNVFRIAAQWNNGKISLAREKNQLAARTDIDLKWVDAEKVHFENASQMIIKASQFQSAFLPLVNWWCENPYRQVPENIKYPKSLERWVTNHNNRTKAYDYTIRRCAEKPILRKGLIDSLMAANIQRSLVLSKFPKSLLRQMQIKRETPFLNSYFNIFKWEWSRIVRLMDYRLKNMAYMVPHEFGRYQNQYQKVEEQILQHKKLGENQKFPEHSYKVLNDVSKGLVILETRNGKSYLAATVKIKQDVFVVTSQSLFLERIKDFKLKTFSGEILKPTDCEINKEIDLLRFKIEKSQGLKPLELTGDPSESKIAFHINPYNAIVYPIFADPNCFIKGICTSGSPVINSRGDMVGVASRVETNFSENQFSIAMYNTAGKWESVDLDSFSPQVFLLQAFKDFYQALESTRQQYGKNQFIEINTGTHRKLNSLFTDINNKAMEVKFTRNNSSMARAVKEHENRCFYYTSLKRLSFFYFSNARQCLKVEWPSAYLKQQAEFLAKQNQATEEALKQQMKKMVKEHPATKHKL